MKKYVFFTLSILSMMLFIACSKDDAETIYIDKTEITLYHGRTYVLKIHGNSEQPTFVSENPLIASVNANGVVTGKCIGETEILVKANNHVAKCKINIIPKINFIPDPYLGFGEPYEKVKNVVTNKDRENIIKVTSNDNSIAIVRSVDRSNFVYGYFLKNGVLTSVNILLNTIKDFHSVESLLEYVSERYYPIEEINSNMFGFVSPNKKTIVIVNNERNMLQIGFAPVTKK